MSDILATNQPNFSYKKELKVEINCPNCNEVMKFDAQKVDIGNIVKCDYCNNKSYYPFSKPWYKKSISILLFIISLVIAFGIGLLVNFTSQRIDPPTNTNNQSIEENK